MQINSGKILMCGNDVIAEAAVRAGCRFYAGYPITPQNELPAYMSHRMPEAGGVFIQAESELAAVNMVMGAAMAGERAMTSSSSPGISLKQEAVSYMAANELPAVIVNIMRGGPGLGNIAPSQADYFQAVKGGGHGDYNLIVLAPSSLQEMADLTGLAFELAEKYRNPVMLLADGILGQMMEPVEFGPARGPSPPYEWALTGASGRQSRFIRSLLLAEGELEEHNTRLQAKFASIRNTEARWEELGPGGADLAVVAYGTCARIAKAAIRASGVKGACLLRPITLWPFPEAALSALASGVRRILVLEMSAGQMVEDVKLAAERVCPVFFHGRTGGGVPAVEEVAEKIKALGS